MLVVDDESRSTADAASTQRAWIFISKGTPTGDAFRSQAFLCDRKMSRTRDNLPRSQTVWQQDSMPIASMPIARMLLCAVGCSLRKSLLAPCYVVTKYE